MSLAMSTVSFSKALSNILSILSSKTFIISVKVSQVEYEVIEFFGSRHFLVLVEAPGFRLDHESAEAGACGLKPT